MICSEVYVSLIESSFREYRDHSNVLYRKAFFDFNGPTNFSNTFDDEDDDFTDFTISAGK